MPIEVAPLAIEVVLVAPAHGALAVDAFPHEPVAEAPHAVDEDRIAGADLEEIQDALRDNPSGQGDELTPLILIRPV